MISSRTLQLCALLVLSGCTDSKIKTAEHGMPRTVELSVVGDIIDTTGPIPINLGTTTFTGSGVFISHSGHILTCAHLFDQGQKEVEVALYESSTRHNGRVLLVDPSRDLALVKIDAYTPQYARRAHPGSTRVAEEVIVVGSPRYLGWTVTSGIVSAFRDNGLVLQTDADINPGNSGGPVFNLKGDLIGIAVAMHSPFRGSVGLNIAVSVQSIEEFLSNVRGL